jgi:hypothetical protein
VKIPAVFAIDRGRSSRETYAESNIPAAGENEPSVRIMRRMLFFDGRYRALSGRPVMPPAGVFRDPNVEDAKSSSPRGFGGSR